MLIDSSYSRIVYFGMLMLTVLVDKKVIAMFQRGDEPFPESSGELGQFTRRYMLFSRCSRGHVQILGKNVPNSINAFGNTDSIFAKLLVQSEHFRSQVKIQSSKNHLYLCFNRQGKLITRYNGKSPYCSFYERIGEDDYTEFQSVLEPEWFMGFNRRGRALPGSSAIMSNKRQCYQFTKRESYFVDNYLNRNRPDEFNPGNIADALIDSGSSSSSSSRSSSHHRHRHDQGEDED